MTTEQTAVYNSLGMNAIALEVSEKALSDRLRDFDDPDDIRYLLRCTWKQVREVAYHTRGLMKQIEESSNQ